MTTQKIIKTQHNKLILAAAVASALFASMPAQALEAGDILARARLININPNVNSGNELTLSSTGGPYLGGSGLDVKSKETLDIDFTYMVTNNFGVELLLAVPPRHDVVGTGAAAGTDIGSVRVLPPALIAQWHFLPSSDFRPYVGLGVNYTFIYDENSTLGAGTDLKVDDTWGAVAQAGIDIAITKQWFLNFDAKYIQMNTHGEVSVNGVRTVDANFDLNPVVLGMGLGMKF